MSGPSVECVIPKKACPALDAGLVPGFPPARSPWRGCSWGWMLRRGKAGRKKIMLRHEATAGQTEGVMFMFDGFKLLDIETSGARIRLRPGGSGPPLLLLHGNPLTHASWHKMADRLAERFHVIAADLRGYGDSVGPEEGGENHVNYSFRAMALDQVEVMRKFR